MMARASMSAQSRETSLLEISVMTKIATGANTKGRREVLGLAVEPSETEPFWKKVLCSLVDRGLRGVQFVIADDHKGLTVAAKKVLHATIQRCRVYCMRKLPRHRHPTTPIHGRGLPAHHLCPGH